MPHHFTKSTESTSQFCNHCGRVTQHRVSNGRIGLCMEHESGKLSKAQEWAERERKRREEGERQLPLI